MNITKTTRIFQLPKVTQQKIEKDVRKALADHTGNLCDLVGEALDGRLCDIEDLIDINKYLVRI